MASYTSEIKITEVRISNFRSQDESMADFIGVRSML